MIRLRGNTKHTQRNGFEPGEITVEVTLDREEDYTPGTISDYTQRIHRELAHACNAMNSNPSPNQTVTLTHQKDR